MSGIGFVGGAYPDQSMAADVQTCINFMPEKVESGAGKRDLILLGTPGLALFSSPPDTPLRGKYHVSTVGIAPRDFAVCGSTLFEIFTDGTFVNRGAVENDGKPVSFASSNIQLMIASGGQGYCLTFATNALFGPVTTIAGVTQVINIEDFFLALIGNSQQWFVSTPEDGTSWDPGQTSLIEAYADNAVSLMTLKEYACFFGKKKSVCYFLNGASPFPFGEVPGGFAEQGAAGTFGQVVADNTIFGVWEDELGKGVAFRAQGYTFQRISTHAIEFAWSQYPKISDLIAMSYQDQGHTIAQWTFPSANSGRGATWCFDVATGLWFEKAHYLNGVKYAHPSAFHSFSFGKHLVGDLTSGNIYQMSMPTPDGLGGWNFVTDFGNPIIRERVSPFIGDDGLYNFVNTIEVLADAGLGPNIPLTDGSGNSRGPQIMFQYSKDNGHTWSNEIFIDMGLLGQYKTRMIVRRLGRFWGSTGMVFRIRYSDPAPIRIVDLVMDPPVQRLAQKIRAQT